SLRVISAPKGATGSCFVPRTSCFVRLVGSRARSRASDVIAPRSDLCDDASGAGEGRQGRLGLGRRNRGGGWRIRGLGRMGHVRGGWAGSGLLSGGGALAGDGRCTRGRAARPDRAVAGRHVDVHAGGPHPITGGAWGRCADLSTGSAAPDGRLSESRPERVAG